MTKPHIVLTCRLGWRAKVYWCRVVRRTKNNLLGTTLWYQTPRFALHAATLIIYRSLTSHDYDHRIR